jgi:hypothetical protein
MAGFPANVHRMPDDPELHVVTFAFDAAFQRFREASADDPWMAELSNMLHHLYRLRNLCKTRLTDFEQQIEPHAPDLKLERGATWARNCDTHQLFRIPSAGLAPVYAETYSAVYGELLWRPRTELPLAPDRHGRYLDYESELAGNVIPDTLRRAFDALVALL